MKIKTSKKAKGSRKKLDIAALAIADNIVFSRTDQWAYFRLSNTVFDFLSNEAKVSTGVQLVNAFGALMGDRQEPLECHLIVASTPVDVDAWEDQVRKISEDWQRGPGFDRYIAEQAEYLRNEEYLRKVTYLGINIGRRGALDVNASTVVEAGLSGAVDVVRTWLTGALHLPGEEITAAEEKEARRKEEEYYRTLSTGNLNASRCTAEELLLLMKRQFYPAMSAPYLDVDHENRVGPGDLALELSSAVQNKMRWLKISQMLGSEEYDGYRACLTVSKLPREVNFPHSTFPFLYLLNKMGLPFTSFARFTLIPTAKMRRELEKKKLELVDQIRNLEEGTGTTDAQLGATPADVIEAHQDMQRMNDQLAIDKNPWVQGVYRIVVETPDETTLKKYCSILKQKYGDLDINLNWSVGDQASLFLEQMPGDRIRSEAHKQVTDLVFLGTSGFNFASDVGDLVYGSDANGGE